MFHDDTSDSSPAVWKESWLVSMLLFACRCVLLSLSDELLIRLNLAPLGTDIASCLFNGYGLLGGVESELSFILSDLTISFVVSRVPSLDGKG